jgi:hypothetical protein
MLYYATYFIIFSRLRWCTLLPSRLWYCAVCGWDSLSNFQRNSPYTTIWADAPLKHRQPDYLNAKTKIWKQVWYALNSKNYSIYGEKINDRCPIQVGAYSRSQWRRGLKHEMSSLLEHCDCVLESHSMHECLSAFILCLCVGSGLATGWSLVQRVLPAV